VDRIVLRLSLAAACLALVVGALLVSLWVPIKNFEIANFEKTPKAREVLASVEGDEARTMAARWFASESNRALFPAVAAVQIAGAMAAALLGLGALRERAHAKLARRLLFLVLALAIAMAPLVPLMTAKGRQIDFVSRAGGDPPAVREFKMWHSVYSAADVLLLASALALIPLLSRAASSPRTGARP
jgi:hypothetical protein